MSLANTLPLTVTYKFNDQLRLMMRELLPFVPVYRRMAKPSITTREFILKKNQHCFDTGERVDAISISAVARLQLKKALPP